MWRLTENVFESGSAVTACMLSGLFATQILKALNYVFLLICPMMHNSSLLSTPLKVPTSLSLWLQNG